MYRFGQFDSVSLGSFLTGPTHTALEDDAYLSEQEAIDYNDDIALESMRKTWDELSQ